MSFSLRLVKALLVTALVVSVCPAQIALGDPRNAPGKITSIASPNPNATPAVSTETYDASGNTLTSGGKTFVYDFQNRLIAMYSASVFVTLQYDADGNRIAKTVNGVTIRYLVDDLNPTGFAQVVEELVNGTAQRTYTYGLQRISQNQQISNAWTPSFYGYDGGGTVRLLTDSDRHRDRHLRLRRLGQHRQHHRLNAERVSVPRRAVRPRPGPVLPEGALLQPARWKIPDQGSRERRSHGTDIAPPISLRWIQPGW